MSGEIGVITPPSIFGKLPALGDFVRHNAPLDQVEVWRTWFDHGESDAPAKRSGLVADGHAPHWLHLTPPSLTGEARLRAGEPCFFVLRPHGLEFPSDAAYLIGVLAASRDRVGRRYPLVIWQAASTQWAGQILGAPAHWLIEVAQLVHDHIRLPHHMGFTDALEALWAEHRPGWRDRLSLSFKRLAASRHQSAVAESLDKGLTSVSEMPQDWPAILPRRGSYGCVWQAGADSAIEIDSVRAIRHIVAGL